jgi:hypothetical protein
MSSHIRHDILSALVADIKSATNALAGTEREIAEPRLQKAVNTLDLYVKGDFHTLWLQAREESQKISVSPLPATPVTATVAPLELKVQPKPSLRLPTQEKPAGFYAPQRVSTEALRVSFAHSAGSDVQSPV